MSKNICNIPGKLIKKSREDAGLSQAQLARLVGFTSRQFICQIEKGRRNIPASKLKAFAMALGISLHEINEESED